VELIAAHAAPHYKVQPFDYIYLLELKTARRELVRGNLELAHAALCRALRDPAADSNVWFDLANVLLLRRDGAAAVPWFTKVLELDPKDRRVRAVLGDALLQAGRIEEARAAWLQAAGFQSQDAAAIVKLAAGYFAMAEQNAKRSDLPTAERLYRRAIVLDPNHARARGRLADVLEKLGFTESAERWSATVE
jgi:tetratricopeptide (TPR) repeat protein